jgi:hypothetical protein
MYYSAFQIGPSVSYWLWAAGMHIDNTLDFVISSADIHSFETDVLYTWVPKDMQGGAAQPAAPPCDDAKQPFSPVLCWPRGGEEDVMLALP